MAEVEVRPAAPEDEEAVARLFYDTARGMYDMYAGSHERAIEVLRRAFRSPGTNASREIVTVAVVDGSVAGAMASSPDAEGDARAKRFRRLVLRMTPPWRWPGVLRLSRLGAGLTPEPPPSSLYVDALATDERFRRRGVATALLDEAARQARDGGFAYVALDTASTNAAAQALYDRTGFEVTERRPGRGPIPGPVGYARRVATRT